MAWLTDWNYRKQINITGQSGAGTNYQVKVLVGESSGATGENFDLAEKAVSFPSSANDSGDIRFTASDGDTLLSFWVESVTGTTPNRLATIWVKVSANLDSNQSIYIYYGKSGAANVSSGSNTFIAFDDFEWGNDEDDLNTSGGSVTWTKVRGSAFIDTARAYGGTRSARFTVNATYPEYTMPFSVSNEVSLIVRFYKNDGVGNGPNLSQGDGSNRWSIYVATNETIRYYGESETYPDVTCTPDAWQKIEIFNINHTAQTYSFKINDGSQINATGMYNDGSYNGLLQLLAYKDGSGSVWYDDLIVRKWKSTEPAYASAGGEEESSSSSSGSQRLHRTALSLCINA